MNFSDFKCNFKQLNEFKDLMKKPEPCTIMIVGDNGTGKTSFFEMLQNENKYDILLINDTNFTEQIIQNFIQCKTITSFFSKLQKVVFIDDVDVITNISKQTLTFLSSCKNKCKIILTVKSKEEKKVYNTWKKLIEHRIKLNKIDYKECFQVLLKLFEDRDDIDHSKLLGLIKAQNCNIYNIKMLIDNVTYKNNDISVLDSTMDIFHQNVYNIVDDIYNKQLQSSYLNSLCSKDNYVISSMVHENLTNLKLDIDSYLDVYEVLSYCDLVDKHIYISCGWGVNLDLLNIYRFTNLNNILYKNKAKPFTISFTQQFTKLSSQMNIKKKLHSFVNSIYTTNTFDLLYHLQVKDYQYAGEDKIIKDLVTKFKKDFNL
ncbi:hypothetical protein QKU58_gp125 [Pyramimonas orientalis virus]|uniref:ATPase AAA-type core domain-containing protein n=1 Tax=Pyramimonas orientalis virus 01B TaxID=3134525 RepID=A0A7M3UNF5_9VIRU|nr:hypothetical protein QKU58_gp125 [Pyramimonas orientalis virus]QOI90206.1 hypothetical protein HWQ62_00069 [Pyramimonas orientalis virus]